MPISNQQALHALEPLFDEDAEWLLDALLFGTEPSTAESILQRFNVDEDAHGDLIDGPRASMRRYAVKAADGLLEFRPWIPGTSPDSQQLMVARPTDLGIADLVEDLLDPGGVPLAADNAVIPWADFSLEVRVCSVGQSRALFLRKATNATFLRNKRRLIFRNGHLDAAHGEMVAVENTFDAVVVGGIVFMRKPGALETLLELREQLEGQAETIVQGIVAHIPIEGVDELVEAAGRHWQMLRKLHHIQQQDYLEHITMDDIVHVVQLRNLPITIEGEGGARRLSYDQSDKWAILRLLDDDYLHSELTDRAYEVKDRAKTVLEGG